MTSRRASTETSSETSVPDDLIGRTIIGLPLDAPRKLTSLLADMPAAEGIEETALTQTLFKVRLADNDGRRNTASMLVRKMYAWRGYKIAWQARRQANRVTLVASHGTSPMATISVGFDSVDGLLVDELYKEEVDGLRAAGCQICEFTKLAVDGAIRSKRVLGALFHIAVIYAHRMHGGTDLVIEVNPRHVRFYQQMLGFVEFGPERNNARVNAPAILLRVTFDYLAEQIELFGGKPELARSERSLFPYFFSLKEEKGIIGRLSKGA